MTGAGAQQALSVQAATGRAGNLFLCRGNFFKSFIAFVAMVFVHGHGDVLPKAPFKGVISQLSLRAVEILAQGGGSCLKHFPEQFRLA